MNNKNLAIDTGHHLEGGVLILGDCLQELKSLPDKFAQVCVTSPPYNMNLRVRNGQYVSRQIVKEISTKYIGFDDNLTMEEYFIFNKNVINELLRVSELVFFNIQMVTGNKPALFKLMGHFHDKIKETIIWDKVNAQPSISNGCLNSRYEFILVLSQDDAITRSFDCAEFDKGTLDNLWQIKRERSQLSQYHGATFPTSLVETIILNFTKQGDMVLDPFMGTGTAMAAAKKHKRRFLGVEINEDYFNFAKKRVDGQMLDLF